MSDLLRRPERAIRKDVCWAISNVCAGTVHQIQSVIGAGLVPDLIGLMRSSDSDVHREAAWCIGNMACQGNPQQVQWLIDQKVIPAVCDLLTSKDPRLLLILLETLENFIKLGKKAGHHKYIEVPRCALELSKSLPSMPSQQASRRCSPARPRAFKPPSFLFLGHRGVRRTRSYSGFATRCRQQRAI